MKIDLSTFDWNSLGAISTFLAVLAALFLALWGDWVKSLLFHPKLTIELLNPSGEMTSIRRQTGLSFAPTHLPPPSGISVPLEQLITQNSQSPSPVYEDRKARYYHLLVKNLRKYPVATATQVSVLQIEERNEAGEYSEIWSGEIPLRWKNQEIYPAQRNIGHSALIDLGSVVNGEGFYLHPVYIQNNFKTFWNEVFTIVMSLQAISNEGRSEVLKVKISWDWKWHDGEKEMGDHLKIEVVKR